MSSARQFLLLVLFQVSIAALTAPPRAFTAPTSRFHLSNITGATYFTRTSGVTTKLFRTARPLLSTSVRTEHPRVLTSRAEWHRLLDRYASPLYFDKENTWSRSILRLTRGNGPESEWVLDLASRQSDGSLDVFTGRDRTASGWEEYRRSLKPTADLLHTSNELTSHGLFLCAFWASVSARQEDPFLDADIKNTCVNAALAWAKILLAHRIYHCEPRCPDETNDANKAYVWNFNKNWEVHHDWYTGGASLALAYDVLHDDMSVPVRRTIRSAIAMLVMKRWSWGTAEVNSVQYANAQTHPHRMFSNWAVYHSNLYLTNLAIEGESDYIPYVSSVLADEQVATGFNSGLHERFSALIDAYLTHSINPDGSTFEDGYTFHTAFREGSLAFLAHHIRGNNVLDTARFRNTIHHAAQMQQPWQCGSLVGHASGGGLSYPSYIGLFRYVYPDGPLPKMLWAQRFGTDFVNDDHCRIYWTQTMMQMVIYGDEHQPENGEIAYSPNTLAASFQPFFPISYVSTRRGLIITRSSLSENASYMHLDARPDAYLPGHDNADRGVVTFSALQRTWLDDLEWSQNIDSRHHSLMHIDGLAQAEKAPSVTIMKVVDNGASCVASADLSYAYNYHWARSWQGPSSGTSSINVYADDGSVRSVEHRFLQAENLSPWDLGWAVEDDGRDIGFFDGMSLNGYDWFAFQGLYQWKRHYREENNMLSHMVRSTIMVRSENDNVGFGVIVDVVGAESGTHTFESYLILNEDVDVVSGESSCENNACVVVLKSKNDTTLHVHVRTMGQVGFRREVFDNDEKKKRIILKTSGLQEEQFWIALLPQHDSPPPFDMRRANGQMVFDYDGNRRVFAVEPDHSVSEVGMESPTSSIANNEEQETETNIMQDDDQEVQANSTEDIEQSAETEPETSSAEPQGQVMSMPPMEPIDIEFGDTIRVTESELNAERATFYHETRRSYQHVFHLIGRREGVLTRLSTCDAYTTGRTRMAVLDCGDGAEGRARYSNRDCWRRVQTEMPFRCSSDADDGIEQMKTDFIADLKQGREYYIVVSISAIRDLPTRLAIAYLETDESNV